VEEEAGLVLVSDDIGGVIPMFVCVVSNVVDTAVVEGEDEADVDNPDTLVRMTGNGENATVCIVSKDMVPSCSFCSHTASVPVMEQDAARRMVLLIAGSGRAAVSMASEAPATSVTVNSALIVDPSST